MPLKKRRSNPKCPKVPTERDESMALVKWAKTMVDTGQEPRLKLLRCGFEGLRLGMGLRMQVKRQSIATGWPDFFLAVSWQKPIDCNCVSYFHGLFIELKRRKGGTVSQEQMAMHVLLMEQGYEVCVAKGADEAIATIRTYLGME